MVDEKGTPITIGHLTTAINQIEQWSRIVRLALVEMGEDTPIELSSKISDVFVKIGPPKEFADCAPAYRLIGPPGVQVNTDPIDFQTRGATPGKGSDS